MNYYGNIVKLQCQYADTVRYQLPIGQSLVELNSLIGKNIRFEFEGVINCIATGERIKKSYNNGYSYRAFMTLAACDICIVKPEKCHYHKGTCREPEWGEAHCMKPHVLYLANTSGAKVGITRQTQVPTRWMDQGAVAALPILSFKSRYLTGLLEKEISKDIQDKTNWRKMLSADIASVDLKSLAEQIFSDYADLIDDLEAEEIDSELWEFEYPVESFPEKLRSLSFDKQSVIEGVLLGIKGQYLIFDSGVLNMRKHQGYALTLEI